MAASFPDGVWPVMLTPFTTDNDVDYPSLGRLIDWYSTHGANGLFAVCQSSEMFQLTLQERVEVAAFVKKEAAVPVVASGHIADREEDQFEELLCMAETGIDALILISNRLASPTEGDDIFLERLERLIARLPKELPLGFYECPYPYKRLLSAEIIRYMRTTGRFSFIKDTSCDLDHIRMKLEIVRGSGIRLYNANTATLLESLRMGAAGYSGVMANFHPELYARLIRDCRKHPDEADCLQNILTMCSLIETRSYPVNAKYLLQQQGVLATTNTRRVMNAALPALERVEMRQLAELSAQLSRENYK